MLRLPGDLGDLSCGMFHGGNIVLSLQVQLSGCNYNFFSATAYHRSGENARGGFRIPPKGGSFFKKRFQALNIPRECAGLTDLRRSRTTFCREAALTYLCARRAHLLSSQGEELPAPHSLFAAKRERAAGAVQERKRQGHQGSMSYMKRARAPGPPLCWVSALSPSGVGVSGVPSMLQVGQWLPNPRRFFSGTARRHRLGRRSRHGTSAPRRKCGV